MSLWAPMRVYGRLSESMKVCNCAECGQLLLGADHANMFDRMNGNARRALPPMVADWFSVKMIGPDGRMMYHRRPWCQACLERSLRQQVEDKLDYRTRRAEEFKRDRVVSLGR